MSLNVVVHLCVMTEREEDDETGKEDDRWQFPVAEWLGSQCDVHRGYIAGTTASVPV